MKTKIRTFIGLVALGVIGFTSTHATAANNLMSSIATVETTDNLTNDNCMLNSNLRLENAEAKTVKAEKAETEAPLEVVEGMSDEDFFKAAESYTASGSDREIEKYATKQIAHSVAKAETQNSSQDDKDFFLAAESFTASGSNKEIEKYANMQVALQNEKESR
ncbi:MAG: hypothetical protein ACM3P1_11995 [Candidatus Saccharibacteria bacterium]